MDKKFTKISVIVKILETNLEILKLKKDIATNLEQKKEVAKQVLLEKEIEILVDLNDGNYASTGWGCDLTYEYVHINGDYRS